MTSMVRPSQQTFEMIGLEESLEDGMMRSLIPRARTQPITGKSTVPMLILMPCMTKCTLCWRRVGML